MPLIKTDTFNVEYVEEGSGPAVILLHSSASGLRQWRLLFNELKDSYRMIAVNLFGYGATSAWPAGKVQTLADQARLVVQVAVQVEGPVTLAGHSLGGAVAMETALHLDDRLQGLIVFEPILFSLLKNHGPVEAFTEIHDLSQRYSALGEAGNWDQAGEIFVDYWSGAGAWSAMSDERKAALRVMLPNVLHEWDSVIVPSRPLQDWGGIPVPVHVLRAADTCRPTFAIASLLIDTHRQWSLHEFDGGGHMAPVTYPDLVNPIIAKILMGIVS